MNTKLDKGSIYIGCEHPSYARHGNERYHVLGTQFGPWLLCAHCSLETALDEWDERHGERVNPETDASTLADYVPGPSQLKDAGGDVAAAQILKAMEAGDIRINDGGTMVWVDHYEWCRSFKTAREAGLFYRTGE